jgi:hypothetical protein
MINMINWVKNKIVGLLMSFYGVEKNILSSKNSLEENINVISEKDTGTLLHSLKNNIVTQEVLNLKWRTYKILKATEGVKSTIIGYDEDGMPIVKTTKKNPKLGLKKIKVDDYDDYKLEMVLDNTEIALNTTDVMGNEELSILDSVLENYDDDGNLISVSHATIGATEHMATQKGDRPIKIERIDYPNFLIENYTKKLNVRKINKKEKMLEFYISSYPDEYNKTTNLLLSAIKKVINGKHSTFLDFEAVEFLTFKTIGSEDFLLYRYENIKFDKIVEFNGFYIIKFKSDVVINGKDILEQHKVEELDKKYEKKLKK